MSLFFSKFIVFDFLHFLFVNGLLSPVICIFCFLLSIYIPEMSKKKEKSLHREVEDDIARLSEGHEGSPEDPPGLRDFLTTMMQQQQLQHTELLKSLSSSSQSNCLAVVTAVTDSLREVRIQPSRPPIQAPTVLPPCPPPSAVEEDDYSSDDDFEFLGWNLPQSGQVANDLSGPIVHLPGTSAEAAPAVTPQNVAAAPPVLDEGLFMTYEKQPNWNPPQDTFTWLKAVIDKEVPPATCKEINEAYIPELQYQSLFSAALLPQAIIDRLFAAPKYLSKGPKIINDHLLKAQREILIAYKPFIEILSFYFSQEFLTLKEFVPELAPVFDNHKMLLSQGLALLISAGIKISRARKDALRPIFTVPAVLKVSRI